MCSFDGCCRRIATRKSGLCFGHYQQRRKGQELQPLRARRTAERCAADGCERPRREGDLCVGHRRLLDTTGTLATDPQVARRPIHMSRQDVAQYYLDRAATNDQGCKLFAGRIYEGGYGKFKYRNRDESAHRFVLEAMKGPPIDRKLVARHHCDNPACINPDHLDWGTQQENTLDRKDRKRSARDPVQRKAGANKDRFAGIAVLDEARVLRILEQIAAGRTNAALGREYGVSHQTIADIRSGHTWGWLQGKGSKPIRMMTTQEKVDFLLAECKRTSDGCLESPRTRSSGYPIIGRGHVRISRLVLEQAQGPPPEGKPLACHTCDNKRCCDPNHLYWGSAGENGIDRSQRGPRHQCARLTPAQVQEIRQRLAAGERGSDLAIEYGVTSVSAIARGRTHRWLVQQEGITP